ncbi:hypothetical protein DITRI_Ditri19aG0201200 [Diplodiscus trichospermus]
MGLAKAMSWICELGYKHAIFEADAKIVVDAILAAKVDGFDFGSLVLTCRTFLHAELTFSLRFVRRQANVLAHAFARLSHSYASPQSWCSMPSYVNATFLSMCTTVDH